MKEKIIKITFIILSILLIIPSVIYLVQNRTILGFETYYNFFINEQTNKTISTIIYLLIFISLTILYFIIIKQHKIFKDIKQILIYVAIISLIFCIMLPWTSSDIFYYMGVGEIDAKYGQNPYYVTIEEYYNQNSQNLQDTILEQASKNVWSNTTVVYGPIAQLIFKICTAISLKNVNICLVIFKIINIIIHLANCYLIYKICHKKIFSIIYGINPFVLIEFIGNVHNDIIIVFFVLLSLYFLLKKKNIILSIIFLALATGIKYFTILLLPIIVLYYFRKEEKISMRILRCIQYGIIFILMFALEYIMYFKDINVIIAMLPQTERYSKSIYSALSQIDLRTMYIVKGSIITIFVYVAISTYIKYLIKPEDKTMKMLRKYNLILILFILILTNCQQWYLVWLFATIMWQKPNTIKNIIALGPITEIANTIYMFKSEWFIYDIYFVGCIICLFIIWQIITNNKKIYNIEKTRNVGREKIG